MGGLADEGKPGTGRVLGRGPLGHRGTLRPLRLARDRLRSPQAPAPRSWAWHLAAHQTDALTNIGIPKPLRIRYPLWHPQVSSSAALPRLPASESVLPLRHGAHPQFCGRAARSGGHRTGNEGAAPCS